MHVSMNAGTKGSQNTVSDPLKLELQAVVNHSMCVLGIELGFSTTVHAL